jgi:long-chain acyl-CoA synthetase
MERGAGVSGLVDAAQRLCAPGEWFEVSHEKIRGISTRTWRNCAPHLRSVLQASIAHGSRDFIRYGDEVLSYNECFAAAGAMAARLRGDHGISPGDRVAIAMRNYPEWVIAFWAAIWADAVLVPLNSWWSAEELEFGIRDSGARVLVADGERVDRLGDRLDDAEIVMVATRAVGPLRSDVIPFEEMARTGVHPLDLYAPFPATDSDATIMYTSGTTGRPKGAVATHRNVCSNLMSMQYLAAAVTYMHDGTVPDGPVAEGPPSVTLAPTPLFHVSACFSGLIATAVTGGTLVLMYKWDPEVAVEIIENEDVVAFGGVPSMIWGLLDTIGDEPGRLSSLMALGYGSAPAPPELLRQVGEKLPGRHAFIGYGLTETTSITSSNRGADYLDKPESVGPPVPVVEVKVVDSERNAVSVGAVGELLVKGPNVVRGYWNAPEATEAAIIDGWLASGDLARLDDEGFIYIVDRAKDMILRGGENVYSVEVESVLMEHPAVDDVALIGVPHRTLGEEVGAVVKVAPGHSVDGDELSRFLTGQVAGFKVPTHYWWRTEDLPRNASGKVLKRELRESLGQSAGSEPAVASGGPSL